MAVFNVSVTAPNGNMRSRPIVAENAEEAISDWTTEVAMDEPNLIGFSFKVEPVSDPDGNYERLLLDGERRRLEAAFYAIPGMRSRRRR